ncbi:MAG: NAD(P)-dependent oxidoreductase [Anaerolineaceae bacterium]|nr:NAD(P)-dependent oxidoreductase [Anaerolineaceae bacterium]
MILVIGGFGFVGANTVRALLDLDEACILTQHKNERLPGFLKEQVGKRIFIESLDITDVQTMTALGRKYTITGIVDLATGGAAVGRDANALVADLQATIVSIAAVFQAAQAWGVKRVSLASAPVVYNGLNALPWREDHPLAMTAAFPMEAVKKCGELLSSILSLQTQVESIEMRIGAVYGPNYDTTRSGLVGRLVHEAVNGAKLGFEGMRFGSAYAADAGDQCYIKDAARAVALLQTADRLNHKVYNVASGYPTTNQAIVEAIQKVMPEFAAELPVGHMPGLPESAQAWYFDITRLHDDIGFVPEFDIDSGIADYIAWLQAGNER